jgi:hypothetical protein
MNATDEAEEVEEERRSIQRNAQMGATGVLDRIVALIGVGGRSVGNRRKPKDVAARLIGNFNPKFWDDDEDPLTSARLMACAEMLAECSRLLKAKEGAA